MKADAGDICPCGRMSVGRKPRPLAFAHCCGRYTGEGAAPDAESLMRSRYTAFAHGDVAHLNTSWHASTRPAELVLQPGLRWLGLQVKAHRAIDADHAEVEFVARSRDASGRAHRLHELSRFVREAGRWYYVDGDLLA